MTNKGTENKYVISSGEYKLTSNLSIADSISVASGTKATLDLNGFALNCTDNSHSAITVESGAELTIIDSSNGKGSIKGYNSAKGGVVFVSKNAKCTLKGIKAEGSASLEGGVVRSEGNLTVENCTFNNCGATGNGGVIANFGSAKISHTKFTNNKAGEKGGVIYNSGDCEIDNCTFAKNQAADGGAIYNQTNSTIKATFVEMSENQTTKNGGGAVTNHGKLTMEAYFKLNNNTASGNGGAIWTNSLEIHDLYIANNQADGHGGAIRNKSESATVKVYDTNFANNTANGDGGAASIHGKNEFHNCKFYGNTAGNKGGALDITGSSKTNFYGCNIHSNTASKGSAIRYASGAKYNFYDNTQVIGTIY